MNEIVKEGLIALAVLYILSSPALAIMMVVDALDKIRMLKWRLEVTSDIVRDQRPELIELKGRLRNETPAQRNTTQRQMGN